MLVGRREEIATIEGALDRALVGRSSLVLVSGEPGIGKSRLAEEAAALATRRDLQIGWGRAWEAGGAPAFWPWIQALRALRRGAVEAAGLERLLPELGAPPRADSADDRFAMFDAVLRFLSASTERRGALVVLEDVHAADPASLQLLVFVAAHVRDAHLALLATHRDEAGSRASAELLERAGRGAQRIRLRRLRRDEVAELAAEHALDAGAVARLHRATDGNPLFVVELLRLLAPGEPLADELPVPASVRALVRERLARVSPERRASLEAAALIGREFVAPLLAAVCGRPLDDLVADLAAAREAGLLVERAPGRHGFSHGLFADALRQDAPAARRAAIHLAIADQLERLHLGDPAAPLAEIAHHLLEAGPGAADRAIAAARGAADAAVRQLAFEQAAALLERAADAARSEAGQRAELLLALAHARTLAGEIGAGQAACLEAAAIARQMAAPELLARAALGHGAAFTFGFTDQTLVALLEEALAALPDPDSPLRARLMARLAAARQPARDPDRPIAVAREAIAMARRLGDERTRLDVFHAASAGLAKYGPPAERIAIDEEASQLAARLGEPSLALRAHARLVFDHVELGEMRSAQTHVLAYEDLAAALARPGARWAAAMFRAMFALYQGRFADQARHLDEAGDWIARADDALAPFSLEMHRIGTLRTRGDDQALDGAYSRLWRQLRSGYGLYDRTTQWMVLARLGRGDELRPALSRCRPDEVVALRDPTLATWAAEAAAAARDRDWAEALYAWLAPRAGEMALQAMHGMFVDGPIARPLFLVADVLGRDDARDHFERALETVRGHGARPLEARILFEWGEIRCARGDAAEGRAYLEQARELAVALELPLLGRIEAVGGQHAGVELMREGEYWTVRGVGGTVRLRHSRGLEMLSRLVERRGREVHALELVGAPDDGDAGEVLDRAARDAYRARLQAIAVERDRAEAWNDSGRVEMLRVEEDAVRAELARAVGLGGRVRRAGSASERARVNAQRRLADAIRRIQDCHAGLGAHLARAVRTGTYCSYDPDRAG